MTRHTRLVRSSENILVGVSVAAIVAVILANVIRVYISGNAAFEVRATLFTAAWVAAAIWAVISGARDVGLWLASIAGCGLAILVCQHFAGGVGFSFLPQIIGPAGAGVGAALLIRRAILSGNCHWLATAAAAFGCVAAVWLALEPGFELWKLLPNDWEISKHLDYRWGIRMGQDRARFLFDTPMEAGVVQWIAGTLCLVAAMDSSQQRLVRWLFGIVTLMLYASVALTYSRAGLVLGAISIGLTALILVPSRKVTLVLGAFATCIILVAGVAASRLATDDGPAVRNVTSIFDPHEEANRIRLRQFSDIGSDLAETPWHGQGASSFVTYAQAPRMPRHESSPINLVCSFGIGGALLVACFAWNYLKRGRRFLEIVAGRLKKLSDPLDLLVVASALPFAAYSLVAPVLAGLVFGVICFTVMGLLTIWDAPLRTASGKP